MNDPNGGTCLKVGAATNHDVNGYFLTAGGNIIGSGVYTLAKCIASQVTLSGGSALASSCSIPGVGFTGSGVVSLVQ